MVDGRRVLWHPPSRMSPRLFIPVLLVAACGADVPDWKVQETPNAEAVLARHVPILSAALASLPSSPVATPCSGPEPELPRRAVRPGETSSGLLVVGQARAAEIVGARLPLFPAGEELYDAVESGPYYRLFRPMSGSGFAETYSALDKARYLAVVVTESMEEGVVENQTITRPASFAGWAVIVELQKPRVVAQLRLEATSHSLVAIHHRGDLSLTANLVQQVFEDLDAKLTVACPTR